MDPSVGTTHSDTGYSFGLRKPLRDWLPGAPEGLSTLF